MRTMLTLSVLLIAASSLGCAMCNNCGDDCYTFYGGSVPRENMCYGRVGSRFEPAGEQVSYVEGEGEYVEETYESVEPEMLPETAAEDMPLSEPLPETNPNQQSTEEISIPAPSSRRRATPESYLPQ
jgi:hypothetical protein